MKNYWMQWKIKFMNINKFEEILIYSITITVLTTIYLACFNPAYKGYGYSGYRGFHNHHSIFYIRHYDEGFYPSNREDSVNGNRFSKRGLSGGK